jgi:serine/threonine protein kinase
VGSGGFGVVYRAQHLHLDPPVALKVLRANAVALPERRAALIRRFSTEGKLAFGLGGSHPAIARVFEAGVVASADGTPLHYLAMEWLEGMSLAEQLRAWRREGRAPLGLDAALELLSPIAEALSTIHERGIAHRDVKPANIVLARRGSGTTAVLLDFGLAKVSGEQCATSEGFEHSETTHGAFTPSYAAPEQWLRRLGPTGPWTDVHALALICVELLSGRRPFDAEDTQQLLAACVDRDARPLPRRWGIACSPAVEAVLGRALAVSPHERFPNAHSFWAALRSAAEGSRPEPSRRRPSRKGTRNWRLALLVVIGLAGARGLSRQRGGDSLDRHAASAGRAVTRTASATALAPSLREAAQFVATTAAVNDAAASLPVTPAPRASARHAASARSAPPRLSQRTLAAPASVDASPPAAAPAPVPTPTALPSATPSPAEPLSHESFDAPSRGGNLLDTEAFSLRR